MNINDWSNISSDKTESLLFNDNLKSSNLSKDSFLYKDNNDFSSFENKSKDNSTDTSGNEELDDYYDNFYK